MYLCFSTVFQSEHATAEQWPPTLCSRLAGVLRTPVTEKEGAPVSQ